MIRETLKEIKQIELSMEKISDRSKDDVEMKILIAEHDKLMQKCKHLTPEDKVYLARLIDRPHVDEYINVLFTDFFEQKGDHLHDDDNSIYGGIALYKGKPVTVIGHRKGNNLEDIVKFNFGMPCPEGYRKALRIMRQAEKFHRPIITFIDTPGAYPGLEAEAHGQGEAIAKNLAAMSSFTVPIISVVIGEANSGGALAIGVANKIIMLENAVYSILSPEGFASILWKDASRSKEACELMKLTSEDLLQAGVADEIVREPLGGAQTDHVATFCALDVTLEKVLKEYEHLSGKEIQEQRRKKFRMIGR